MTTDTDVIDVHAGADVIQDTAGRTSSWEEAAPEDARDKCVARMFPAGNVTCTTA